MLYIIEFVVFVKKILKYLYKLRFGKKINLSRFKLEWTHFKNIFC